MHSGEIYTVNKTNTARRSRGSMIAPLACFCLGLLLAPTARAETEKRPKTSPGLDRPSAVAGRLSADDGQSRSPRPAGSRTASRGSSGPLPRAAPFPQSVPAAEIHPAATLPLDAARDLVAVVAGKADGRVVVINREDLTAKSMVSSDAGVSYSAESLLPSGPPSLHVVRLHTDFNLDNGSDTIHALLTVGDPGGDLGLQVVRSDNFGVTWGAPVDVVRHGDDTHGVDDARLSATSGGVVAVVYREARGGDPYIRVSSDAGQNWAARVRLNASVADGAGTLGDPLWVEVDATGVIHVAFVQGSGIGRQVFYTRSTDGGVSFEPERTLDSLLTARTDSTNPILQTAFDGSLLLALWDAAGDDHLYVLRSTDAGQTFALVLDRTFGNEGTELFPMLFASTQDGTVVVHVIDGTGELTAQRSTNNGVSYGPVRTLSSAAAAHPFLGIDAATVTETDAGTLAIAYTDRRADAYLGSFTDLFVQVSTNDGQTWASETRVDGTAPGTAGTSVALSGISGVGSDDLVVVYADNRGNAGSSFDIYGNRSAAATPNFADEQRIDGDTGDRDPNVFDAPSVAVGPACGGGAGEVNVYVAMAVMSGKEPEIRVAVSEDGGYTFSGATRISDTAGTEFAAVPRIAAPGNGSVHVAYTVTDSSTGDVELRYNKSDDCGQTWLANELNFELVTQAEFDLVALDNGEVYLVWSEGGLEIRLAKSTDGGASFLPPVFVNTNLSGFNRNPSACVVGGTVFVAFAAPDGPGDWYTTFLTASGDGGATFVPEIQMLPDMANGGSFEHTLDCYESLTGTTGVYAVVMANSFGPTEAPFIRWFGFDPVGGTLTPQLLFQSSPGADYGVGSGVRCLNTEPGPGTCLFLADESVSEANDAPNRIALRQYDPNGVVGFEQFLTADAPLPEARSETSRMVTDGQGNVWVAWRDFSAGEPQMVVRHSADSGQTIDSLYRLSRAEPQGTAFDSLFEFIKKGYGAANAGEAFFVWAGRRDSQFFSGLFGVYDTDDFDRDQSASGVDCNDEDPTAQAFPSELTNLFVDKIGGGVRVSWDSQAGAGSGTAYGLVKGQLGALRSSGSFAGAACLAGDILGTFFDDLSADPPVGEADYYLGQAKNSCGPAGYGDSSLTPDPRDDLDSAGPCP